MAVGATAGFPGERQGPCEAGGDGDEAEKIAEEVRPVLVAGGERREGVEGGRWPDSDEEAQEEGGWGGEDSLEGWVIDDDDEEDEDEDGAVYFDDDAAYGDDFDEGFDRF